MRRKRLLKAVTPGHRSPISPRAGPFAIQGETNVGPNAAYDIVRPIQLGEEGRKHPIISWNNGTLYQIDRYQDLLDHWASHGFVVMGGHTNRTAGGAVHKAAIDWLVAENARTGSVYFGMLDLANIGAAGHSQGGGATITAGANVPGPAGIVTTMPLMPISSYERPHLAQHAASMLMVSASEDPRANRAADQAFADVTTEFVDAQFVGVHEDAMNPGIHGATVAWFRYQLMGGRRREGPVLSTDDLRSVPRRRLDAPPPQEHPAVGDLQQRTPPLLKRRFLRRMWWGCSVRCGAPDYVAVLLNQKAASS